jgi:signal transduction histidine kinase
MLTLVLLSRLVQRRISAASIETWQFPLFPFDVHALVYFVGVLLSQVALCWTTAVALGVLAERWRFGRRRVGRTLAGAALWLAPTALLLLFAPAARPPSPASWATVAAALAAFGLLAGTLRRFYRHTTYATRLVLLFAALAAPPLAAYPLTASAADAAARTLVETEFAPAILHQPQAVHATLTQALSEIDGLAQLEALLSGSPTSDGAGAFAVWSRTSLAASRLTSEVELYGPDRRLVGRFALNLPEPPYEEPPIWAGTTCDWSVFGEVTRLGAGERILLTAERGVCGPAGSIVGAIVVKAVADYRALPFVSSSSPYTQALRGANASAATRLAGLEVVVYGWSGNPHFTSGGIAWPVSEAIAARLYATRDPFWEDRTAGGVAYRVYYVSDRRGFYALGYPRPTFMEHATRLAEMTAIVAVLLVILLAGATAYAPFLRTRAAPLPALLHEMRTSFYRKLFLFFVLSAVGPLVLLALAFGAYTSARIQADVESEAAGLVTVARRLFEELTAIEGRSGGPPAPATDALLVAIRQIIDQDVNLFVGPRLVATSQRDLFDTGLLPTRTPAAAYREIALGRLPAYVGEDRIGDFTYLVAAAPVPGRGRDTIISVPLGTRQREIEREIDALNRRVLVGAVVVALFAAGLGASVAARVSDPVARLTRAARQISAGRLDVRIVADTADELRRLVDDFNLMTEMLAADRAELARTQQLKAWAQMARQVAHEIKNPLTPIQLAAEHLQRVHQDRARPLGPVFDQCVTTILGQVRLLRRIASDFSNFASESTPRVESVPAGDLIDGVLAPYGMGLPASVRIETDVAPALPAVQVDRTLIARALTNLVENALQAMPAGGTIRVSARREDAFVAVAVEDTGVGMTADDVRRAFEPYFSTKTGGSGLGLPNAKRYVELSGGTIALASEPGRGTTITLRLPVARPGAGAGDGTPTQ